MVNKMNNIETPGEKVKKLATLPYNKICGDCNMGRSVSTNATIGTFVCIDCGNVLRSIVPPHRIQSISFTNYSHNDYKLFQIHGNEMCKKIWLKYFNPRNEYYSKKIDDRVRVQYLTDKYVHKRWLAKDEDFDKLKIELSQKQLSNNQKEQTTSNTSISGMSSNNLSTSFRKCEAPDYIERPVLSIVNSRTSSLYDPNDLMNPKLGSGVSTQKNENIFDPFDETSTLPNIQSKAPMECIFSNDPFAPIVNNAKSENNLFDVFTNNEPNGINSKLAPTTKVEFHSTSQLDAHTKSPFDTNFSSTIELNPFSIVKPDMNQFPIKNSSNIFQKNASMGDIFGAASVTDRTRESFSSPFDKSAASTTLSHSVAAQDRNSSVIGNFVAFNPFDSISEVAPITAAHPNKPLLNCSLNVVPNSSNKSDFPKNSNDLFNHSTFNSHFNPHITSTQSENLFSTMNPQSSSSRSEIDFFTPTTLLPNNNTNAKTSQMHNFSMAGQNRASTLKHHASNSTQLGISTNRTTSQSTHSPFDNFMPVSSNSMTAPSFNAETTMIDSFNNATTNFNSSNQSHSNYYQNNNKNINLFNTSNQDFSGRMHSYGSNGDLFNNFQSNQPGSKYDALRDLHTETHQITPFVTTSIPPPELPHFDDLDAFKEMGFSKVPVVKPVEKKKLTLSQMASKSSLDTVSSNMK